ncbi:HAD family hydrolase [Streptomyces sp. NPDC001351]|uniref:HAD family hydrolase n=1 Tax=Streptomyces sp. NPDC001351 TaxID=3364564 RepID=UPI0036A422A3
MTLCHLRLVAVNIDGVLLNDTFSPVIHRFIVSRGGRYTAEVERAVLSRPRLEAAAATGLEGTPEELARAYFRERDEYLREHPLRVQPGAGALLAVLRDLGVRVVCYGGLDRSHFDAHLEAYAGFFDDPVYVCTDAVRPGIREIAEDVFGLRCDEALFIDDAASVAEAAQALGAPFIGCPTDYEHSFQEQLMRRAGVRHVVPSLEAIDEGLLRTVDAEAAAAVAAVGRR